MNRISEAMSVTRGSGVCFNHWLSRTNEQLKTTVLRPLIWRMKGRRYLPGFSIAEVCSVNAFPATSSIRAHESRVSVRSVSTGTGPVSRSDFLEDKTAEGINDNGFVSGNG